jgi:hypothetical protein
MRGLNLVAVPVDHLERDRVPTDRVEARRGARAGRVVELAVVVEVPGHGRDVSSGSETVALKRTSSPTSRGPRVRT